MRGQSSMRGQLELQYFIVHRLHRGQTQRSTELLWIINGKGHSYWVEQSINLTCGYANLLQVCVHLNPYGLPKTGNLLRICEFACIRTRIGRGLVGFGLGITFGTQFRARHAQAFVGLVHWNWMRNDMCWIEIEKWEIDRHARETHNKKFETRQETRSMRHIT